MGLATYKIEGTTLKSVIRPISSGEDIIIPDGVKVIGSHAINNTNDHASLIMPDTVEIIEDYAISGNFKEIVLSVNLKKLGYFSFFSVSCIKPIIIPSKIDQLYETFYQPQFTEVVLPEGIKLLHTTFKNDVKLKKINLPSSLINIGPSTFEGCTELDDIKLPTNLEYIGEKAFYNTKIKGDIIIPKTIKEIGKNAFFNKECTFYIEGDGQNIKTNDWHHPQSKVYWNYERNQIKKETNKKTSNELLNISDEFLDLYHKALNGDGYSMYKLGYSHEFGENVKKDLKRAVYWYNESAIEECGEGLFCIGRCYLEGIGVEKNPNKAFTFFKKGANLKNCKCQNALGTCYYTGVGAEKDGNLAFKYYQLAANQNSATAIYNLGLCYEYGRGTKINLSKALECYTKSYNGGYENAIKKIDSVKKKL